MGTGMGMDTGGMDEDQGHSHSDTQCTAQFMQSRLTLMVYLNTQGVDFEGGETTFMADHLQPRPGGVHCPRAGDCLVFYQEAGTAPSSILLHQGSTVTSGHKRMMRTVVNYGYFSEQDKRRCMWEEAVDQAEEEMLAELDRKLASATPLSPACERRKANVRSAAARAASAALAEALKVG
jgi:hypothetical protein